MFFNSFFIYYIIIILTNYTNFWLKFTVPLISEVWLDLSFLIVIAKTDVSLSQMQETMSYSEKHGTMELSLQIKHLTWNFYGTDANQKRNSMVLPGAAR